MIADGDLNRISLDQLKALEKMLPDTGQVCVGGWVLLTMSVSLLAVNRTAVVLVVAGHSLCAGGDNQRLFW